jgi:hypothetical protein
MRALQQWAVSQVLPAEVGGAEGVPADVPGPSVPAAQKAGSPNHSQSSGELVEGPFQESGAEEPTAFAVIDLEALQQCAGLEGSGQG